VLVLKDYRTIGRTASNEVIINRSRFIGQAFHVDSETAAEEAIAKVRQTWPDASHHCYAYIIGEDGQVQRFSDDGEPGGTAGMPIMQVIMQQGLKNTLVVVTRYFGGIKLGAGGLVRAYSKTAAEVLEKAGKAVMTVSTSGMLSIPYSMLGTVEHFLRSRGIPVIDAEYSDKVDLTVIIPSDWESFENTMMNLLSGNVECIETGRLYYNWDKGND